VVVGRQKRKRKGRQSGFIWIIGRTFSVWKRGPKILSEDST
jgi:hypothetical protein